jgi:hypothetical protein
MDRGSFVSVTSGVSRGTGRQPSVGRCLPESNATSSATTPEPMMFFGGCTEQVVCPSHRIPVTRFFKPGGAPVARGAGRRTGSGTPLAAAALMWVSAPRRLLRVFPRLGRRLFGSHGSGDFSPNHQTIFSC